MSEEPPRHSDDTPMKGSGQLYAFVDEAHEVTEEERNRPRYGRPVRTPAADPKPAEPPADQPR